MDLATWNERQHGHCTAHRDDRRIARCDHRLSPVLLLPLALHVLQTTPWLFGGGGNWVTAALLVWVGSLGYLPAVLAIAVLRWMMWRQR